MINVIYKKMPYSVKATHVANADDSYTVFLNENLTHEQLQQAYAHELRHIRNGDLQRDEFADKKEIRIEEENI